MAIQAHSRSRVLGSVKNRRLYCLLLVTSMSLNNKVGLITNGVEDITTESTKIAVIDRPTVVWRYVSSEPYIHTNLILPETSVPNYIFVAASIFIQLSMVGSERRMFCAIVCVMVVQGHPRSLIHSACEGQTEIQTDGQPDNG